MSKVLFTIQYEIKPAKRNDYLNVIKELKNLLPLDGIESYNVFEVKGKENHFYEVYKFASEEAYEAFDDDQNERINILINKLNDMTLGTKYTTLYELQIP
jgi:quinol monooxygenase YgiN